MTRKSFVRNFLGFIGVAGSLKEMGALGSAPESFEYVVACDVATNDSKLWVIKIAHDHFTKGDVIMFNNPRMEFYVKNADDAGVIGQLLTNEGSSHRNIRFEYEEDCQRIAHRLCSVMPNS